MTGWHAIDLEQLQRRLETDNLERVPADVRRSREDVEVGGVVETARVDRHQRKRRRGILDAAAQPDDRACRDESQLGLGHRECASAALRLPTMRTICARSVSLPTRSARITSAPVVLMVPPTVRLPISFPPAPARR